MHCHSELLLANVHASEASSKIAVLKARIVLFSLPLLAENSAGKVCSLQPEDRHRRINPAEDVLRVHISCKGFW